MRIATYNIHACIGADGRFEPDRIIKVLQEIDADLFALQEVEHHRVAGLDLLDYLAEQTGMTPIAGPTLMRETRDYGNAVLTRLSIKHVTRIDLSLPRREPRGAIDMILNHQGHRVRVIATHLGLKPWERRQQVRRLLELVESNVADISILLGDLNEWMLWGRPLRWLRRHFAPTPQPLTYPARYPLFSLDRIWVHPRVALVNVSRHNSALARTASDHLPLIGTINL
jgi:endonuclease/exonuclease/phosphatase family metal-dependent hydrolase